MSTAPQHFIFDFRLKRKAWKPQKLTCDLHAKSNCQKKKKKNEKISMAENADFRYITTTIKYY